MGEHACPTRIRSLPSGFSAGAREAWARRDRIVWTLVGLLILIAAGIWGFLKIFDALAPFVIGGFIAFLLRPLVGMFTQVEALPRHGCARHVAESWSRCSSSPWRS